MHNTLSFQWKFRYFFGPRLSFGPFQKKVHDDFFNSATKFNFRTSSTQSSKTFSKPEKNFFFQTDKICGELFFSSNLRRPFGFWSFRKFWFDFSKVCQIGGEDKPKLIYLKNFETVASHPISALPRFLETSKSLYFYFCEFRVQLWRQRKKQNLEWLFRNRKKRIIFGSRWFS